LTRPRSAAVCAVTGPPVSTTSSAICRGRRSSFADLLDEDPGVEADLRALVEEIQAQLPAGVASAAGHSVAAGRESLLTELDARLSAGDGRSPRTVCLCGLGGAGKTSLAVEYAYRHLAEVGVAWQLAAEDATVLAAGFGELAAQFGVRGLADVRDPVASVHVVPARFPVPGCCCSTTPRTWPVAAFLPPAGPGRVLITSQNPDWPGQAVDVPVLEPDVAAGFLISRTGDPDRTAARDLAGVLGGLPPALEQAAAYIRATRMTLAGYLSVFRGRAAALLARGQAAGHPATVASTSGLALSRLGDEAASAAGLRHWDDAGDVSVAPRASTLLTWSRCGCVMITAMTGSHHGACAVGQRSGPPPRWT
jgi:hypothetical protein